MKFSTRAERIEPFYVMEVAKAAQALAREVAGTREPMIFLNIGEPDFTAPPLVQEAADRAIRAGLSQYTPALGLDALRERISGWYAQRFGLNISPERIVVTAGASGNTGSPLHVEDAVTIYNRLGKAIEAQMTGSDGSES